MIAPGWAATSAYYGFFFLAIGAHLPFWPLWLADWGLSEAEIGAYTASAIATNVALGVLIPWVADSLGAPRRMLSALAALLVALYIAHLAIGSRAVLFAATLAAAGCIAGILPISNALALRAAERGGFGYATARSVGSAAFLLANLLCGAAVAAWGSGAALWWIALSFLPLVWLGLTHPGGAGAPIGRPRLADAARLARAPVFLVAMVAGAAPQGSHAVLYAYGSIHWRAQGLGDDVIGMLWAFGVLVEVVLMAVWGRWLIARLGGAGALALASGAGVIRWAAMALDPPLAWLWPLQAMHGLTFTAAHLGVMAFVQAAAPPRLAATAQGLTGPLAGGGLMAAGSFAAAWAYPAFGADAFWIGVALAALGLVAALTLARLWDGGRLAADAP